MSAIRVKSNMLAASKCGEMGWILILLDADDDCPASRGGEILERAKGIVPHRRVVVVLANREFEAWFIASAATLNGFRSFECTADDVSADAEAPRNAKGWIGQRMQGKSDGVTTDQPAFAGRFDLALAYERSRSFRKLCQEWSKNTF